MIVLPYITGLLTIMAKQVILVIMIELLNTIGKC